MYYFDDIGQRVCVYDDFYRAWMCQLLKKLGVTAFVKIGYDILYTKWVRQLIHKTR